MDERVPFVVGFEVDEGGVDFVDGSGDGEFCADGVDYAFGSEKWGSDCGVVAVDVGEVCELGFWRWGGGGEGGGEEGRE